MKRHKGASVQRCQGVRTQGAKCPHHLKVGPPPHPHSQNSKWHSHQGLKVFLGRKTKPTTKVTLTSHLRSGIQIELTGHPEFIASIMISISNHTY